MDESNLLEEIRNWDTQFEEKVKEIFLENQKGLFHNLKTHFRMPVRLWMNFCPCQETSHTAITSNPESNFTRREQNHSLFHWNTLTSPENLDVMQERRIDDYWNIDGSRDLSDSWTGFTQVYSILWESSRRMYVVRGRLTKRQFNIQVRSYMARSLERISKKC